MNVAQNHIPPGITASRNIRDLMAVSINKETIMSEVTIAEGWNVAKIEVSKTEGPKGQAKRISLGHINTPYPTLSAIKAAVTEAVIDPETSKVGDDNPEGIVRYTHADSALADIANFVQEAMLAKVRVRMTNSLQDKSIQLKDGKSLAVNWVDLLSDQRIGSDFLKIKGECVVDFASYVAEQGKAEKVVQQWKTLFRFTEVLAQQPDKYKAKMQEYLAGFSESLSAEKLERYGKYLLAVEDACKVETDEDAMLA